MMSIARKLTTAALGLALVAGTAGIASAQNTAPADPQTNTAPAAPMPGMETPATDFSSGQLEAFAVAYVEVSEIGMSFDQQMQSAQTDEELMTLQAEAQQEMAAAVEGVDGVSVEEYNQILVAAQNDPELGAEIQGIVDGQLQ